MDTEKYKQKRLAIIKEYFSGKTIERLSREFKTDKHLIRIWIGRYKLGKPLELFSSRHIDKVKRDKIFLAIKLGQTLDQICIIYDINRKTAIRLKRKLYGQEEKSKHRRTGNSSKRSEGRKSYSQNSRIDKKNSGRRDIIKNLELLRREYSVRELLKGTNISRSVYYYHRKKSKEPDKYIGLRQRIKAIHAKHKGRYGYRRIEAVLKKGNCKVNHKAILRIMQEEGLKNVVKKVRYRSYKGSVGKKAENLIAREFATDSPNRKWSTDISQVNIEGNKLYISPIQDMFNGEIISCKVSQRPDMELVKGMLSEAFKEVKETKGIILHSDQGWHYQHEIYHRELEKKGIIVSMSRKGNCLDNAKMESFFGTMKKELLYAKKYKSAEEFRKDLKEYINYYNKERIKLNLKGLSPFAYRKQWEAENRQ